MNEEDKQAQETAQGPEETEATEEKKPGSSTPLGGRSVFAYLAVLFGAAFLLLLFAYLMQQRDSAEIMGNLSQLRESMGSIQSIDELTEENRRLREEMEGLKEQVTTLETENEKQKEIAHEFEVELDGLTDTLDNVQHSLHKTTTAMGLFWQLDEAYVLEDYDLCRELIAQMEEAVGTDLFWYLAEPDGENELTRSTGERYREIVEALAKEE